MRRGISQREPDPLPPLAVPAHRPSVLLIVSESVRADAMCSAKTPDCQSRFLDAVAPDRAALGKLTSQSSGTFTSCVMLWTGLGPDADFRTMHHAAVLWDIARAEGYRTAYIGSQNLRYDDFGAFLERASLDVEVSAIDVGYAPDPHLGAPDENAAARLLDFVRENKGEDPNQVTSSRPYFAVLHLSNTHWPYRVDPALQPFEPHDASPSSEIGKLHNHYLNSVLFQERTVSDMLRQLRALPGWDDTAVVFLSDHGEQFREHGGLYHLTSLFEEQVRVPGLDRRAATKALDAAQHARPRRLVRPADLLAGRERDRPRSPRRLRRRPHPALRRRASTGRSLLRAPPAARAHVVLLSTASGVWQPDDAKFGVMRGETLAVRSDTGPWVCFDLREDPGERVGRPSSPACDPLIAIGKQRFP